MARFEVVVQEDVDQKLKLLASKTKRSRKALAEFILSDTVDKMLKALDTKK